MNEMIHRYNATAKGARKCEILSEFLVNFNPMLINSYTVNTSAKMAVVNRVDTGLRDANQQNEATIKILEQRIESMKR
jgi:hypothetical protein